MSTKPAFSPALDQIKTAAIAKALRLKHKLLLTQVAAESDKSLSMLYLMEEGKRKWTEDTFNQYVETIERIAGASKTEAHGATKP